MKEYLDMWKNYANFRGRTSVRGYWLACLFNFLATLVLGVIGILTFGTSSVNYLLQGYVLAALIPGTALSVRRLNDMGRSWKSLFVALIPTVGPIILIVWFCKPGVPEPGKQEPLHVQYASPSPAAARPVQPTPIPVTPSPAAGQGTILDRYRAALRYLDNCGSFDEQKLREFNRISGNQFSEAELQSQIAKSKQILGGMNEIKKLMHSNMSEAITVFEELERNGIDLSKYNI